MLRTIANDIILFGGAFAIVLGCIVLILLLLTIRRINIYMRGVSGSIHHILSYIQKTLLDPFTIISTVVGYIAFLNPRGSSSNKSGTSCTSKTKKHTS